MQHPTPTYFARTLIILLVAFLGVSPAAAQLSLFGSKENLGDVISASEAHAKAEAGELLIVDVRSTDEWRQTGVPANGFAISMHQNTDKFLNAMDAALGSDRTRIVAVICATGSRTTYLQKPLRKLGFTRVMNIAEGMLGGRHGDGWIKSGLPIRKWTGEVDTAPPTQSAGQ